MAVFFMFGKYTHESLRNITARRTQDAVGVIEKLEGQVTAMYAMLGPYDLIMIVNLPGLPEAVEASIALSKLTGIGFMTCPALSVDRFDHLIEIDLRKYMSSDK
ncbi:MAG TPA: GYD domain-containing protein [Kiritimatiellia bacterium]|jgi:uncharacterized protein with GYD domain